MIDPSTWGCLHNACLETAVHPFGQHIQQTPSQLAFSGCISSTVQTLNLPLKIDAWKRKFLLETTIFRGYIGFREGKKKGYMQPVHLSSFTIPAHSSTIEVHILTLSATPGLCHLWGLCPTHTQK